MPLHCSCAADGFDYDLRLYISQTSWTFPAALAYPAFKVDNVIAGAARCGTVRYSAWGRGRYSGW